MLKAKRLIIVIACCAVLVFVGFGFILGFKLAGWVRPEPSPVHSTSALLQQVQTLSDLVTVKYVIEKIEIFEVPSENVVGQVIGSRNRVLLLAHGIVKAGIDLQRLKPEDIQTNGRSVLIILPNARITDTYLDESQTRVIDRTTGLLAPPDQDLEQRARQNAVDSIRRAARKSGIIEEAEERARKQVAALFLQAGFERVEYRFKHSPLPNFDPSVSGETYERQGQ